MKRKDRVARQRRAREFARCPELQRQADLAQSGPPFFSGRIGMVETMAIVWIAAHAKHGTGWLAIRKERHNVTVIITSHAPIECTFKGTISHAECLRVLAKVEAGDCPYPITFSPNWKEKTGRCLHAEPTTSVKNWIRP
jgi:hypothetical protein